MAGPALPYLLYKDVNRHPKLRLSARTIRIEPLEKEARALRQY